MKRRSLTGSLTVRFDDRSLRELKLRAKKAQKSTSDIVRELVAQKLSESGPTAYQRSRKWVGSVSSSDPATWGENARAALGKWSPDRRG